MIKRLTLTIAVLTVPAWAVATEVPNTQQNLSYNDAAVIPGKRNIGEQCQTGIFSDDKFTKQTDKFHIYEKVYLLVHCKELPVGSYTISTQWRDEEGKPHTMRAHEFQIASQQDYSAVFRFKQMKNGTMKQMLSGNDFEDYQYGRWSVRIFLNADEVNRNHFTFTD